MGGRIKVGSGVVLKRRALLGDFEYCAEEVDDQVFSMSIGEGNDLRDSTLGGRKGSIIPQRYTHTVKAPDRSERMERSTVKLRAQPHDMEMGIGQVVDRTRPQLRRGKTIYLCEECGKSFSRPYNLRVHKRLHTGETPFQCEFCWQTFMWMDGFNRHKRRCGNDELLFPGCEQLGNTHSNFEPFDDPAFWAGHEARVDDLFGELQYSRF